MSTIQYNRKCLTDVRCSENERIAAFYDYVGSVYGKSVEVNNEVRSFVTFDGKLTDSERDYVEKEFGKMVKWYQTPFYLINAKTIYYNKYGNKKPAGDMCKESDGFYFTRKKDCIGSGDLFMLANLHGCFFPSAIMYLFNVNELSVAANPGNWLFGIEAVSSPAMMQHRPETFGYLINTAASLKIPIFDPMYTPSNKVVVQDAARRLKVSEGYVLAIIILRVEDQRVVENYMKGQFLQAVPPDPNDPEDVKMYNDKEALADRLLELIAKSSIHGLRRAGHDGITVKIIKQHLANVLNRVVIKCSSGESIVDCANKNNKRIVGFRKRRAEVFDTVLKVSNEMSVASTREVLQKYKDHNVLLFVGNGHKDIAEMICR